MTRIKEFIQEGNWLKTRNNIRLHKLLDSIDIKIDEGIPVNDSQISSIESNTEDTVEIEEEHVQESEKENSELDDEGANI